MVETETRNYAERTALDVQSSDASILVVTRGKLTGGSLLTKKLAAEHRKPFLLIDLSKAEIEAAAREARKWLISINCRKLNVAGSRRSTDARIYERTKEFLECLFGV